MLVVEGSTEAKDKGTALPHIEAEIDQALDLAVKEEEDKEEKNTEEVNPPVEDKPEEGEKDTADLEGEEESDAPPQEEESPAEAPGEEESPEAEARADDLLTRAVRAGMNLKDARTFVTQDADALERQIGLLEKKVDKPDEEGDKSDLADDDLLAGIPDLDPDVDDSIQAGFEAMKSIIRNQGKMIQQLSASAGGEEKAFDKLLETLPVKNINAAKRTQLIAHFEILRAGYKAKDLKVDDYAVFEQATKYVLGDEIKAATEETKVKKLEKREKLHTNRPAALTAKPKSDPLKEVAEEVDKEFFGKK